MRGGDSGSRNIYLVTYRFQHHYAVSGYNRIGDYLRCKRIMTPKVVASLINRFTTAKRHNWLRETTGLTGYFPECQWLEWRLRSILNQSQPSVIHFIYPENSYYFSSLRPRSEKCKMVATYHQPVRESGQFILNTEPIRKLDAVILMSESQKEFFEPLVGRERIFVVHHGIDLGFFTPRIHRTTEKRLVSVGSWLRDFDTLAAALRIVYQRDPEVICDVVANEQNRNFFQGMKNVNFHSGITDEKLRQLYHQSALSVLSLSNTAANNALLESMACGLGIIASDFPAVREYTSSEGCHYVPPGDSEKLAEAILSTINDNSLIESMGKANSEHAKRFEWSIVAKNLLDVYENVYAM